MSKNKVLFIGAINDNNSPLGGEEYKNQLILSKLQYEQIDLKYVDTIAWKRSPFTLFRLFYNLFFNEFESIIISASSVSTYRLLKLIYFIRPQILLNISYLVIGGYFPTALGTGQFKSLFYENLKCVIVEGKYLKVKLLKILSSVPIFVIPNFKQFPKIDFKNVEIRDLFRFVFVGRICKEKGINLIFSAVEIIKSSSSGLNFEIDFFGPIEDNYNFNEICKYEGYLNIINQPEHCYEILSTYDCLLFPTSWKGEGFPGVIIDAFVAGLPVIATDWNMNKEIIKDGENGFIVPSNDVQLLAQKMIWLMSNRDKSTIIGYNNRTNAINYHVDKIWKELFNIIFR